MMRCVLNGGSRCKLQRAESYKQSMLLCHMLRHAQMRCLMDRALTYAVCPTDCDMRRFAVVRACIAICCSVLRHVLRHAAAYCCMLRCAAVCCDLLLCGMRRLTLPKVVAFANLVVLTQAATWIKALHTVPLAAIGYELPRLRHASMCCSTLPSPVTWKYVPHHAVACCDAPR